MFMTKTIALAVAIAATLALSTVQSGAMKTNAGFHNPKRGCSSLVAQAHPALKDKARDAEIARCVANPGAYSKAAGF